MIYPLKMVIFNSYVKLPEGTHIYHYKRSQHHRASRGKEANASVSVDAPHIIGLRRESVRGPGGSWHNVGPSDCYVD
jgi:hypothetical protein